MQLVSIRFEDYLKSEVDKQKQIELNWIELKSSLDHFNSKI